MSKGTTSQDAPFGTLLGYAPGGVAIYSSDYSSLDPQEYEDDAVFRSYIDDEYMGHKWQCVEFARRFLFLNYGVVFTDVGMAWEIFSLRFLREVVNDTHHLTPRCQTTAKSPYPQWCTHRPQQTYAAPVAYPARRADVWLPW